MFGYATALILAAAAPSALATVYVTAPVATTSWAAGANVSLTWEDDNSTPSLASFGPASIGIFVGSTTQQTLLQTIADSLDVSNATSIDFTPDASIGEDSDAYFIRFQSISLMDSTDATFPAQAFSAKFALTGMTGTFNATVLAEMTSSASGSASSTATSGSASSSTKAASTTKASTSSTATASASSDSTSAAESRAIVSGVVGFAGLVAAGAAYFL